MMVRQAAPTPNPDRPPRWSSAAVSTSARIPGAQTLVDFGVEAGGKGLALINPLISMGYSLVPSL